MLRSIGTYLPPWAAGRTRVAGPDEDAVTMAVAAGRQALDGVDRADVRSVVVVSRDLPLLEGGNGAALLAGLDLDATVPVREELGGAPAALAAAAEAGAGVLVIAADLQPVGAAAVLGGAEGVDLVLGGVINRSLPVITRDAFGHSTDYADPRLVRERGLGVSSERLGIGGKVAVVAGLAGKAAASLCEGDAPVLPTLGASAALFGLAALAERRDGGRILATEQATLAIADLGSGDLPVRREELPPLPQERGSLTPGPEISISLAAYERAFDVKLRLEAGRCTSCGTLSLPIRYRCLGCGSEEPVERVPLPRDATVHSQTTIHVPVPSKTTPYTLVLAEIGATGVRLLAPLTGDVAGSTRIGDAGRLVFRRAAVRSGVPDYGYSFLPAQRTPLTEGTVAS
jgi:uncharacterized OB-fold protein